MKFFPILLVIMWISTPQLFEQRVSATFLSKVQPELVFVIHALCSISTKIPQIKDNAAFGK